MHKEQMTLTRGEWIILNDECRIGIAEITPGLVMADYRFSESGAPAGEETIEMFPGAPRSLEDMDGSLTAREIADSPEPLVVLEVEVPDDVSVRQGANPKLSPTT